VSCAEGMGKEDHPASTHIKTDLFIEKQGGASLKEALTKSMTQRHSQLYYLYRHIKVYNFAEQTYHKSLNCKL